VGTKFALKTNYSYTMINYHLSQKHKLLGNDEINHLTIILTTSFPKSQHYTWLLFHHQKKTNHATIDMLPQRQTKESQRSNRTTPS